MVLLHAGLVGGTPHQVVEALGFLLLSCRVEWLALARKHAVHRSGDRLHLLLERVQGAHPFVYPVLPQADLAAFLQFVVNHVFHQIMRGFRRALRPQGRHSTQ